MTVEVIDVVADVVGEVVGEVTSQPWKPPLWKASVILFIVCTTAGHSSRGMAIPFPKHVMLTGPAAGPRYSRTAVAKALAICGQVSVPSTFVMIPSKPKLETHPKSPGISVGQASKTLFNTFT